MPYRQVIIKRLQEHGGAAQVPNQRGGSFRATLMDGCVHVDCLASSPNIPFEAFDAIESLLAENQGQALRGNARNHRLGAAALPLDSVEGRVAYETFGRQEGAHVLQRVTPLTCLLVWAGVCVHGRGVLIDPSFIQ